MYAISLLQGMVFYAPIASLYRQARGLTLYQIALIESISFIFSLAMELPWGILADKIGYKRTMLSCCSLWFIAKVIFYGANSFSVFLLERFVQSVALAGLSGVDVSVLFLSCEDGDSHKVFGRYEACGTVGVLFAAMLYTAFIKANYSLSALLTAVCYGGAAILSVFLVEVHEGKSRENGTMAAFISMFKGTVFDVKFLLFLIGAAFYNEAVQMMTVWLNQNQYIKCGLDDAAIGAVYIAVTVISLVGAFSKNAADKLGKNGLAAAVFLVTAVSGAILAFTSSAAVSIICVVAVAAGRRLFTPLSNEILSRRVKVSDRATQLSVFSLLQSIAACGINVAYGKAADLSLTAAFLMCTASSLVCWISFHICFGKRSVK